jgi:hypothetical protein
MSLQRSLIAHDHRPILDRLPSRIRFATGTGIAQRDQLAPAGQLNRIEKTLIPRQQL